MNTQLLTKQPWLALTLLGIEYALLGWYLSAHHIFWLVSAFIVFTPLVAAWRSQPILESLSCFVKQTFFVMLGVSLLISLVVTLAFTESVLLTLTFLPLITLLYAQIEMQAANFKQSDLLLSLVMIGGLGLGLGEIIDLLIVPSMRY